MDIRIIAENAVALGNFGMEFVPASMLHVDPNQPRENYDDDHIASLGISITEDGQRDAVEVETHPEIVGNYQVINGNNRLKAFQSTASLKDRLVFIQVKGFSNEGEKYLDQMADNGCRKDLDTIEFVKACQKAMNNHGWSLDKVAKTMGKSSKVIENDLCLLKLPKELQALVDDGTIPKVVGREISKLKTDSRMVKAWKICASCRKSEKMLENIKAYNDQLNQKKMFSEEDKTDENLKAARSWFNKIRIAMTNASDKKFANGDGLVVCKAMKDRIAVVKSTYALMAEMSKKGLADVMAYEARTNGNA